MKRGMSFLLRDKGTANSAFRDISSHASLEKRKKSFEEFFWMAEEFKVSVFAQELKTPLSSVGQTTGKEAAGG